MARKIRSNELETRTNRLKFRIAKKPLFARIGPGISLGYRRNKTAGTWVLRVADGRGGGRTSAIGHADDYDEPDGQNFLTFFQAQERAKSVARTASDGGILKPITVGEATANYLEVLRAKNVRTAYDTQLRLEKHFLPKFSERLVANLTKTTLDNWLVSLVIKSDDPEAIRKSKDSANRVLSMVKAVLNHTIRDQSHGLKDDSPWRLVKPFDQVSKPRDIRYTNAEVLKLINSAKDPSVANLIRGAFLTGARYGEMADSVVSSVDFVAKTWTVRGKTGGRTILLQKSAIEFFQELVDGRAADDFLFLRSDGHRWKRSSQTRPFKLALAAAGLSEQGSIYALRHTYISFAIEGGVPLTVIAKNCGTSVRMIEKTYAKLLNEKERAFIEDGTPSLQNTAI
jgi:site-specific recombinase XerD